ncbi:MAG: hypothetical protein KatS3mg027_1484 [Bacteroidia bacterium]|nr:MAG: hypothetical protein KatS3mg027_1484 [Bacteroidia bacterium]
MELLFNIFQKNPVSHYINVKLVLQNVQQKKIVLLLPRWRPGRYELGNFSKNIQNFKAYNSEGKNLLVIKPNSYSWEIFNDNGDGKIVVEYNYYANEYNAGACFADENILYFNPVHLLMYPALTDTKPKFKIKLNVPKEYKIISSLKFKNNIIETRDYDELLDSPIVATKFFKTFSYKIDEIKFYVHTINTHGHYLDTEKTKKDFEQFSKQILKFWGTAPFKEYHFIIHLLPYHYYHGVEHLKNTVIVLGPYHQIMDKLYNELLGVASHELFHAWNIKTLRPKQMYPYNYYTENYSELGFVYEGFTTYYGDKLLWQSNLFNDEQFFLCINERLNRHYINYGKFSQSLLNSSIDTWVDGYSNHAPHKKVSIYDEGCILAMMMDMYLLYKTNKRKSLRDVLLKLYDHQINQKQPYTLHDLIQAFVEFTKDETDMIFFDKTLLFPNDYLPFFKEIISHFGLIIQYTESSNFWERFFGFKVNEQSGRFFVSHIIPDSPAFYKLSLNDEILAINQCTAKDIFSDKKVSFSKQIELIIQRFQKIQKVIIDADKTRTYYHTLSIQAKTQMNPKEKVLFIHYKKI